MTSVSRPLAAGVKWQRGEEARPVWAAQDGDTNLAAGFGKVWHEIINCQRLAGIIAVGTGSNLSSFKCASSHFPEKHLASTLSPEQSSPRYLRYSRMLLTGWRLAGLAKHHSDDLCQRVVGVAPLRFTQHLPQPMG